MGKVKIINVHKDGLSVNQILDKCRHEKKLKRLVVIGEQENGNMYIVSSEFGLEFMAFCICEMQSFYASDSEWHHTED